VKETWIAILLASCALAACRQPAPETPESDRDAIKALGSTIPATQFDHWLKRHSNFVADANGSPTHPTPR
jgi:hypothetical protein